LSKNKQEIITDDNQLIWQSTIEDIMASATWFETKDPNVLQVLTGITSAVTGTAPSQVFSAGAVVSPRAVPRLVTKIVTVADASGNSDTYYLIDSHVDGEIVTSFLKQDGSFEGAPVKFMMNRGGTFIAQTKTYTGS
jgi:hypothetical protein